MQRQALRPDTASYLEASSDKRERANAEPDPDQPDYNAELENLASESESEEQADPDDTKRAATNRRHSLISKPCGRFTSASWATSLLDPLINIRIHRLHRDD